MSQKSAANVTKFEPADTVVWHRWLQPLQGAMAGHQPPLDRDIIEAELGVCAKGKVLTNRPQILNCLRSHLEVAKAGLRQSFYDSNDGAVYVGMHAWTIDILLQLLYVETQKHCRGGDDLAVIAVGGYGRGEMAPYSDIDIMILMPKKSDATHIKFIEFMLYILWDLGLKIGHSSRSISESINAARDDQTVLTSLLEMRHVAGDQSLWTRLARAVQREIAKKKPLVYVEEKLDERDIRHKRFGDTRYVVEPNVKDGKGGLRDLHSLFWIAKYAYRANSIIDIVDQGVLRDGEARKFALAQRFLWTVRCHLHLNAERPEERLDFEAQMIIAPRLGFADRGGMRGVERFMKRYYLAARNVGNLTRIFCAAMETDFRKSLTLWRPDFLRTHDLDPFRIESGRVRLIDDVLFRDAPARLIELFAIAQSHDADIHPNTLQRVTRSLPALDETIRQGPQPNQHFLNILTSRKNPERVLRLMNESGVFGKFLPDFGRIVAMMQFDMYHSYTVDEHTLKAIGILHGIENGVLLEAAPVATEAMPEVESRRALFVAMLLHDIAKGRGGDHSELGAKVALAVCPRLGLTPEETETVSWLILYHLLMSKTAFRYDLNDPQTITDFAAIVQSPERLKLLLVLTVADIRAVGPNIWNGWKAALMRDLYYRCDAVLRGADPAAVALGNAEEARREAQGKFPNWSAERFAVHAANMPVIYWTNFDCDTHVRHARLCSKFATLDVPLLIDFKPDRARRMTELTILTVDDPGLFSRIAGAVAAAGANIVGARITTCHDGTVLDVFFLQDMNNQAIENHTEISRIQATLERSLTGSIKLEQLLKDRWKQTPFRVRQMPVPSRVILSNKISKTHSVIEVNGRDFPGLLHKITHCLADLGLQIQTATVSTYGERVVDVFYVKDIFGLQIQNEVRQRTIRNRLLEIFTDTDEAVE
ncbi:[protein-PII] uridylyltransferase [Candidatus Puniceispirillum sp.]|nr:[protein-PII] uridylyltransferase [Candidatus Puniceispirillum sp.]